MVEKSKQQQFLKNAQITSQCLASIIKSSNGVHDEDNIDFDHAGIAGY